MRRSLRTACHYAKASHSGEARQDTARRKKQHEARPHIKAQRARADAKRKAQKEVKPTSSVIPLPSTPQAAIQPAMPLKAYLHPKGGS